MEDASICRSVNVTVASICGSVSTTVAELQAGEKGPSLSSVYSCSFQTRFMASYVFRAAKLTWLYLLPHVNRSMYQLNLKLEVACTNATGVGNAAAQFERSRAKHLLGERDIGMCGRGNGGGHPLGGGEEAHQDGQHLAATPLSLLEP